MKGRPFARVPFGRGRSVVLWNQDALPGLAQHVPAGAASVVVTSPPYNLGIRYGRYHDRKPRPEYLDWMGVVARAVRRSLAPRGSFFLNVGGPPTDPWLPWEVARVVGESFILQNVIHWVKSIAIDRTAAGRSAGLAADIAIGHYKPVGSTRYLHGAHEYVFHFTKQGDVPLDRLAIGVAYQDASNVNRWKRSSRALRCRGNTWFLPYETIRSREKDRPHPATFPPALPEFCLRLHGLERTRLVVDPFVGIGSSAVAAIRYKKSFVGFDMDEGYLATACDRVEREIASAPRESGGGTARG